MATSVTVNSGNSPYTISPAGPVRTTSSSVSMFVLSGGVADFTTLSSGGFLTVNFGGVNSITTVTSLFPRDRCRTPYRRRPPLRMNGMNSQRAANSRGGFVTTATAAWSID